MYFIILHNACTAFECKNCKYSTITVQFGDASMAEMTQFIFKSSRISGYKLDISSGIYLYLPS